MARAIWSGHLSFGLVQIPIGIFSAESRDSVDFDLLDRRDRAPIGYEKVNKQTREPVPKEEIVKGVEVSPGRHVIVTTDDFKRAAVKSTHMIDVDQFVAASEIEPIYFDRPYFLVPGKSGVKPYGLLVEAMGEAGHVGIGRVVLHTRESVAAIYPRERVLMLHTLRYAHELRDTRGLDLPKLAKPAPRELAMAKRLIEDMVSTWKPGVFKDRFHDALLDVVRRKAKAGGRALPPVEEPEEEEPKGKLIDLTALLEKSLGRKRRAAAGGSH